MRTWDLLCSGQSRRCCCGEKAPSLMGTLPPAMRGSRGLWGSLRESITQDPSHQNLVPGRQDFTTESSMWAETMLPLSTKSEIYQRCDISLWTLHLHHYHHSPTNVLWASALHQMPLFAFIILFFKKQFYLFFLIFGCAGSSLLCGFFSILFMPHYQY